MNRALIALCLYSFLLYSCQSSVHESNENDFTLEDSKKVADDFFKSLGSADTTLLERILTSDFHMFEHDTRWNKDSLLALMPRTIGRVWEISEMELTQKNGLVHISYFNNSQKPLGRSWYESMLLTATDSGLKIKFMHSTKLYLQ